MDTKALDKRIKDLEVALNECKEGDQDAEGIAKELGNLVAIKVKLMAEKRKSLFRIATYIWDVIKFIGAIGATFFAIWLIAALEEHFPMNSKILNLATKILSKFVI